MDPNFVERLEELEAQKPENQLVSLATATVEELNRLRIETSDSKASQDVFMGKVVETLTQATKELRRLYNKPEAKVPDNSKKIIDGLAKEFRSLSDRINAVGAAVRQIDVSPNVNVAPAKVDVPTPQVEVNVDAPSLKGVEEILNESLPKILQELIESIPEPDNSDLEKLLKKANSTLKDILERPIPVPSFPGSIAVTGGATAANQTSGNASLTSIDGKTPALGYATKITEVGTITYIAKAAAGSSQASAVWQAQKINETTGTVITWADGNTNFDNVATDLTVLTYS